jgi:hypothetical protein
MSDHRESSLGPSTGIERVGVAPGPDVLWSPRPEHVRSSNLSRFIEFVGARRGLAFSGYNDLHGWSVRHLEDCK